jgi:4'-phosphopantetheinyl transferase EntD
LLPHGVVSAAAVPSELSDLSVLYPQERAAIEKAVSSRQEQYCATRVLARQLFEQLGVPAQAIVNRPDRSPIWPAGYHGTITHTAAWCAVAIAPRDVVAGLGIDVESARELETDVVQRVLTSAECVRLPRSGRSAEALGALVFSAKESVYKCVYPTVQRFIGFSEVELGLDFAKGEFWVENLAPELGSVQPLFERLRGRFALSHDLWLTAAFIPT